MLIGLSINNAVVGTGPAVVSTKPRLVGAIEDRFLVQGSGPATVDAAAVFSGAGLSFALTGPDGVAIDAASGLVTIETQVPVAAGTVVVTARNAGGSETVSFAVTVAAELTVSVSGTAEVGATLTAAHNGGAGAALQWLRDGAAIAGAMAESYTLAADDEGAAVAVQVTAGGQAATSTPVTVAAATPAAPQVVGAIADQSFVQNTGTKALETTTAFAGNGLVFSVTGPAGLSIDQTTGIVTIPTAEPISSATVAVTARNAGGEATLSFAVTVAAELTVSVSGTAEVGATLTATHNGGAGAALQWLRDGAAIDGATAGTYALAAADESTGVSVRVTDGGQTATSAPVTVAAAPPTPAPAPVLSGLAVDEAANSISVTADVPCRLYWCRHATGATPDAATVIAGGGYDSGFLDLAQGTTSQQISFAVGHDGPQGISVAARVEPQGTPSNVLRSAISVDTTPPTLSAATAAADGATAATARVTTNEGGGSLYWVVTAEAAAPSAAEVKAGKKKGGGAAVASGAQPVTAAGVQTLSPAPSGLAAATAYHAHFVQEDAAGERSAVVSSGGFTTEAASTLQHRITGFADGLTGSVTTPPVRAGDTVAIVARRNDPTAAVAGDCSLGTLRASTPNNDTHVVGLWTHKVTANAAGGLALTLASGFTGWVVVLENCDYRDSAGYTGAGTSFTWPAVAAAPGGRVMHWFSRRAGSATLTYDPAPPAADPKLPADEGFWDISTRQMVVRAQASGATTAAQRISASGYTRATLVTASFVPV